VILTVLLVAVLIGVLSGLYPGIYLSSFRPIKTLNGVKFGYNKGGGLQHVLVIFQFVVSIVLFVSVFTIKKQLNYVKTRDLGFGVKDLIYINVPYGLKEINLLQNKINGLSGVVSSCCTGGKPVDIWNKYSWRDSSREVFAWQLISDTGLITNTAIELIEGRFFNYADSNKFFVANEAFMREMKWTNIENKNHNGKKLIGVIKDFHFRPLYEKIDPLIIDLGEGKWHLSYNNLNIRLKEQNFKETIRQIEKIWKSLLPDYAFNYGTYSDWVTGQYKKENSISWLLIFFACLAVLISCLGILGLTTFLVERRTKEIGIRKSNGANTFNIVAMLLKQFAGLILIAFIIACPVAGYIMHAWLENFAYKTELSLWIFALAGLIALFIALLTISWQAWRAASRNPVESLRYE
jgi:putative ABC transport system permease protein